MNTNLLIIFSEVQKLSLLYLAYKYNFKSAGMLILYWLLWQLVSSVILGKLSDIKGRKFVLYFTVFASVVVSFLAKYETSFKYALFIDGLLVATLPIAFAAKSDKNPLRSKRLIYAEAFLARAITWLIVPTVFLISKFSDSFWENALLISSLLSVIVLFFFNDVQDDTHKLHVANKGKKSSSIYTAYVFVFLMSLFFSESSYQTISYLVEEKEEIISLTKSYILFGLGMSLTCGLHLLIKEIKGISLSVICASTFFITFLYFFVKFVSFSWEDQLYALNYTEKTVLGVVSGVYIPLIYAIICEKFKIHQQGTICGLLESTMTLAEIISPFLAYLFFISAFNLNLVFFIDSLGFFVSFAIIWTYLSQKRGSI